MNIDLSQFDESAFVILKTLAQKFPVAAEIGFPHLFSEDSDNTPQKIAAHMGTIAFLRHENLITHEIGSVASFILTRDGLALFEQDIIKHLKSKLSDSFNC